MERLTKMFHPITGTPFQRDETYMEVPPCDALKPYIRCFWGTEKPVLPRDSAPQCGLVIPDTCMDVIFDVNYTRNTFTSTFCGLDDASAITTGQRTMEKITAFGIRFYAWTAVLFTAGDMGGTKNVRMDAEAFSKTIYQKITPYLFEAHTLQEKKILAEMILLKELNPRKAKADVMNAVFRILETKGREKVDALKMYTGVSNRKLERDFDKMMGISPKKFMDLVRYQLVWQEMVFAPVFDALDAVEKYGYTDQSHLLHDFRKHHIMSPGEALAFAGKIR